MKLCIAAGVFVSMVVVPAAAWAQATPTTFGKAGQLAISLDQPLGSFQVGANGITAAGSAPPVNFQYITSNNGGGSFTYFALAPAADYFVIDNLSIGGQLLLGLGNYSPPQGQGISFTTLGVGPQVGYDVGLSDSVTFWPKVSFGFTNSSVGNNGGSTTSGTLGIFAPILWHPVPHFFIGIGPAFWTQLFVNQSNTGNGNINNNPTKLTAVGLTATFGGWFLGD